MVTGPLRVVLWILGGLGVLWLLLGLATIPVMGRMMANGGMMNGGMMGDGGMMQDGMMGGMTGMGGMMTMMGMMIVQFIAMLGLTGVFVYLVVDSLRNRPSRRSL
ncbi:MAG: hypothetical protein ACREKN_03555 [Longimicrobiaceae bacterium]